MVTIFSDHQYSSIICLFYYRNISFSGQLLFHLRADSPPVSYTKSLSKYHCEFINKYLLQFGWMDTHTLSLTLGCCFFWKAIQQRSPVCMKHSLCAHKSLDAYNYVLCVEWEASLWGTEHLPSITFPAPPPHSPLQCSICVHSSKQSSI